VAINEPQVPTNAAPGSTSSVSELVVVVSDSVLELVSLLESVSVEVSVPLVEFVPVVEPDMEFESWPELVPEDPSL
jgi:hypothetical protein